MANFYNRFILPAAHLRRPFYDALKSMKAKEDVSWSPERIQAFEVAKAGFTIAALLTHPSAAAPVALTTGASDFGVGAVCEHLVLDGPWLSSVGS